jgi:phosphatidylserine/phosphatidylglycerophosphate/cardiolipin synthase-like enzyme
VDAISTSKAKHTISLPEPGRNCWRVETAQRAAVVIDAADYFAVLQEALKGARHQILMIGWDFDTRICLDDPTSGKTTSLGRFVMRLAKQQPGLQIRILKWNLGALKIFARGSMLFTVMRWMRHRRITLKLDSAHPVGASHHQKLIVIDDAFAFCGGIDITSARWDTREHRDDDPRRKDPDGTPYEPWHDITLAVDGPAARALGGLARDRWERATGKRLQEITAASDPWPEGLDPTFRGADVAISRTRSEHNGCAEIRENEALFVDMINSAKRFIYAENQYFASSVIAEAVARRLAEDDPPEFVLVMPETADGWLEQVAMDTARSQMMTMIARSDHKHRFRVYSPVTEGGNPIYVHAKLTIVDDEVIRIGSSNMNNRSLGLDSECDISIDARLGDFEAISTTIAGIRLGLMAEHLGCDPGAVETAQADGSLIAAIEGLRGDGRSLRPITPDEHSAASNYLAEEGTLDPGDENAPDYEAMTRKRWRFRKR